LLAGGGAEEKSEAEATEDEEAAEGIENAISRVENKLIKDRGLGAAKVNEITYKISNYSKDLRKPQTRKKWRKRVERIRRINFF